jgi:hypothetical protein
MSGHSEHVGRGYSACIQHSCPVPFFYEELHEKYCPGVETRHLENSIVWRAGFVLVLWNPDEE